MVRLCDILNEQVQHPDTSYLEIPNPAWNLVKDLFLNNVNSPEKASVSFIVQTNGLIYIAFGVGKECKTPFTESDISTCIDIAKSHGLAVGITNPSNDDMFEDIDRFIEISFTPSNLG